LNATSENREIAQVTPHGGSTGEVAAEATSRTVNIITFRPPALEPGNSPREVWQGEETFIHELFHQDPRTGKWDDHDFEHQEPFNNAADSIIGPEPK